MLVNLLLLLTFLAVAFAGPALNWQSVAIDASGKYHIAAAAYNNDWAQGYPIYLSDDYGVSWRQSKSPGLDWRNVYSDSTGQLLIGYAAYNSFSSSSSPPLYISKDRGNTWTAGSTTAGYPFTSDITKTNSTLWTVLNLSLYASTDYGKVWTITGKFMIQQNTVYTPVRDASLDATGQHRYVVCDDAFFASHNSGASYTPYYNLLFKSVETDSTGQYVFLLNAATLQYSSDYASTWTVLKDFTVSGAPVVTPTFLKITSDNKYVYMLQKSSSSSTTTNLVRFTVSSKASKTVFSTSYWVNDVAISASANSMSVSTTSNLLYTTNNAGTTWMNHTSV
eukprot:gene15599-17485_t